MVLAPQPQLRDGGQVVQRGRVALTHVLSRLRLSQSENIEHRLIVRPAG